MVQQKSSKISPIVNLNSKKNLNFSEALGKQVISLKAQKRPTFNSPLARGRGGLKRHQRPANNGTPALGKFALKRLARRAGVKRINAGIYEEGPIVMRAWLKKIIGDAVVFTEHGRRKTVTINDIIMALKRNGITLYGYNMTEKRRRISQPVSRETLSVAARRIARRRAQVQQQHRTPATTDKTTTTAAAPRVHLTNSPAADIQTDTFEVFEERASQIQSALMQYFRHGPGASSSRSDNKLSTILEWVSGYFHGSGKSPCATGEMDVVLEALEINESILIDGVDDERKIYLAM